MSQALRFDDDVPQVPLPTVPVTTMKLVDASVPLALIVAGVAVAMSQPPCPLAFPMHSTRYTWSLGSKPVPDTFTVSPFFKPVLGLTTSLGELTVGALGVTLFEAFERGLVPAEFLATTVKV